MPRDPALQARMREVSPVISRETTMWKAWIGFNASHGLGAVLFGLVYGYLALAHPAVLFQSAFLLGLGLCLLGAYTALGKALLVQRSVQRNSDRARVVHHRPGGRPDPLTRAGARRMGAFGIPKVGEFELFRRPREFPAPDGCLSPG